ncbi:MAG: NADH-quinone oxidoreductase subunit NuoK [Planctomycetes bacterium]|nr:NADH-quinone oxidoreductase subunit NuoK [Planctomycetota bacterium]
MTLQHCLLLAAAVFAIGVYGLITRRQAIGMLISLELLVNSANLALVAFAKHAGAPTQPLVLFVLAITVAEVAVGLALVMLFYRRYDDTLLDQANEARG